MLTNEAILAQRSSHINPTSKLFSQSVTSVVTFPYVLGLELIMYLPSMDPSSMSEQRGMTAYWNSRAEIKGAALLFAIQDPCT